MGQKNLTNSSLQFQSGSFTRSTAIPAMKLTDLGLKKKSEVVGSLVQAVSVAQPSQIHHNRICIQVIKRSCLTCSCSLKDRRIEAYWGCISPNNRSIWWISWDTRSRGTIWWIARTPRGSLRITIIKLKIKKRQHLRAKWLRYL